MSFWEDASPIVKGAIIVGVLVLLYFGVAFIAGLPPFPGSCSYPDDSGATQSGCPAGHECINGECLPNQRGLQR
ncbi:MAG: hypothetical protein ACFCGT_08535 [Sandaracinaceae bacterium]